MLSIFLLFVTTTSSFWVHDCILLIIIIDVLHLLIALLILNDFNLHKVLLFLTTGWVLTIFIIIALASVYIYSGDMDLFHVFHSNTLGLSPSPSMFYVLLLAKLYIMPGTIVLIVLYTSFKLDILAIVTFLFTVHFTCMIASVLSNMASIDIVFSIILLLIGSIFLITCFFLEVSDISTFLGLSFATSAHMLLLLSLLPGSHSEDLISVLLSAYIALSIIVFSILQCVSTRTLHLSALNGLYGMHPALTIVLMLALFLFMGMPPSLVFILKADFLAQA
jgi:NADH:ubiquinone oxidoreductase subunit 2 (subunit N)